MLAYRNTVLILRLDCPGGYQQYWALIPPESRQLLEDQMKNTTLTSTKSATSNSTLPSTLSATIRGSGVGGGGDEGSFSNQESGPNLGPGSWTAEQSVPHMVR